MALIEVVRYMAQNTHQMMLYLMFCGGVMDTTINLDEELLAHAQRLSGVSERTQLIREALLALVQRESAKRLAQLGGTQLDLQSIPRRQDTAK